MWWRAIFIAVVCLLLILLVTSFAAEAREDSPGLLKSALFLDLCIALGGVKTILDTTRTAGKLVTMGVEVQKMQLEIEKLQRDEKKDGARIVIPTGEQIDRYGKKRSASVALIGGSSVLIVIMVAGFVIFLQTLETRRNLSLETTQKRPTVNEPAVIERQESGTFACGKGRLVVHSDGEIEFSDLGVGLPFRQVIINLSGGQIMIPLTLPAKSSENKQATYVGNIGGDIRFRLDQARIGIEGGGGPFTPCSPVSEEEPERPSKPSR